MESILRMVECKCGKARCIWVMEYEVMQIRYCRPSMPSMRCSLAFSTVSAGLLQPLLSQFSKILNLDDRPRDSEPSR